jgi:D-aminoacyl-tRNA deacylase
MRFAIAYCKNNIAGKNIVEEFKKIAYAPDIPIIELKKETIYSDEISEKHYPKLKNIDFIVFASTHKSEKKFPSLCLHAPGNWRNADLGGNPGKICKTSAFVIKYLFQELNKLAEPIKSKYSVTLEVTHHGPLIEIPCCFIEVGSSVVEWNDLTACKIIAKTILTLQDYPNTHIDDWKAAVGIGGPHYAPNFNKIQLNSEYATSHIIPNYVFPITEAMLKEAEEKTLETINEIIIDWKAFNSVDRQKTLDLLKQMGFKYKRTSEIEK